MTGCETLLFAGECFFGASAILGIAFLIARDGSASQRHFVWTAAFVAMLVLPLAAALVPSQVVFHLPAAAPLPAAELVPTTTDMGAAQPVAAAPMIRDAALGTPAPVSAPLITPDNAVRLLFAVWALGVVAIAARTAFGFLGLYRLHRRSVPHIPNGIAGEKFRGPHWQLRLRTAPGNEGPVTYGVIRSTVLLPKASVRWPRAQLEAVLLHEFAHVCRKDCLTRLIALATCAFYWPNPFVWSAAARLRREAEIAADDYVLQSGVRASSYADALVGLARDFGRDHAVYAGVGLSMAERSSLKDRVQAILSAAQPRMGVTRMDMLKVVALGAAVTAGLVLVRPSLADAVPEPPVAAKDLPAPPDAPPAPADVPAPPASFDVPAAPPAPPPLAHKHHRTHAMRIEGDGHVRWDGNVLSADKIDVSPEEVEAMENAHHELEKMHGDHEHIVIIKRAEIDKAVAEAMKAQRMAVHMNREEVRKVVAEAQAVRIRALEKAREEIDRQLDEARKIEAEATSDEEKGDKGPKGPK